MCSCACVCVGCGSSELGRTDTCTHMQTYTLPRAFYMAAWLIAASLGVLEQVQKNHFSFKDIFFSFPELVYKINSCLPLLYYCCLGLFLPPPHLLRGDEEVAALVVTVTHPTFPQTASLTESSGDHINHFPCFTLQLLLSFVFVGRAWIIATSGVIRLWTD